MSPSDDLSSIPPADDSGWNLGTYRDYLDDLDDDCRRWSLPWVQICLFKSEQPLGFEMFRGRLAALGIDRLGLDAATTISLLEAIGGDGVRVPSTPFILRVVRPWHALFEVNPAVQLSLPENWLEGLELWQDRQRIWIGRRVLEYPLCPAPLADAARLQKKAREKFESINWSLYQENLYGWQHRDFGLTEN